MGDPKHAETVRSKNKQSPRTAGQEAAAAGPALPGQECRTDAHESWTRLLASIIGLMLAVMAGAAAANPALPGEECRTDAHASWSGAEAWAWGEICEGRIADFNKYYGLDERLVRIEPLDPNQPDGWDDETRDRQLSPTFLEAVLLHEPWRGAVPRQGVRILGAWFPDELNLAHGHVSFQLWLEKSRFSGPVDLTDLRVDRWFSFEGSAFADDVSMQTADLRGYVSMAQASYQALDLIAARFGGLVSMNDSTFKGDVLLGDARIDGWLSMTGSTFEGAVGMGSLEVAGSLFMSDKATF